MMLCVIPTLGLLVAGRQPAVFGAARNPSAVSMATSSYASIPDTASAALDVCRRAAKTKAEDPDEVCEALLEAEQAMRKAAKADDGELSRATLKALDGAWRLVFTTGTVETQSKRARTQNSLLISLSLSHPLQSNESRDVLSACSSLC